MKKLYTQKIMNQEIDMDELCKGCLSYERVGEKIPLHGALIYGKCPGYIAKDINCPCQHCLIKIMCNAACEDLKKSSWYNDTYEELKKLPWYTNNEA